MMACTSPLFTARSRPLRIFLPSISTCRFLISSKGITRPIPVFILVLRSRRRAASRRTAKSSALSFETAASRPPQDEGCGRLAHTSLKAHRDQLLRLNGELHRKLLQHVLDETVHDQCGRFL